MNRRQGYRNIITVWSVLGGLLLAGVLIAGVALIIFLLRPSGTPVGAFTTPVITVIPAPTLTPVVVVPTLAVTPTRPVVKTTPGGPITLGAYVQISGTGGDGLRLRTEAGLGKATEKFLGMESEVFLVKDGPRQADGYVWWYLEAPYDKNRSGWAVSNYLVVVETP